MRLSQLRKMSGLLGLAVEVYRIWLVRWMTLILVILGEVLRVILLAVCTKNTKYIENAIGRGN